jgi:formate dehydrogenase iron-sulfur subunit
MLNMAVQSTLADHAIPTRVALDALNGASDGSPTSTPMSSAKEASAKRRLPVLPIAQLLDVQKSLTAVQRFAQQHEEGELPSQARYYKDLIPLSKPKPGEQYAFEVDLDKCTGCKACVSACHTMNGLDAGEAWRSVGLLHGGSIAAPTQQTVTTSCHHCVEPACMYGCPVNAYEKDPVTGIVKHLDDQCFGCQYCTLMCPYDAPKYNAARGIVRKCDMCSDRLEHGEAPACVQACPNEAIAIRIVEQSEAIQTSEAGIFLPGAPAPDHTTPTTIYSTARSLPHNLLPADFYSTSPEHPHLPLVVLLTFTQLAVGVICVKGFIEQLSGSLAPRAFEQTAVAAALTFLALAVGVFHLGRPLLAWRSILNLRRSWFSREALAFGVFYSGVLGYGALVAVPHIPVVQSLVPMSLANRLASVAPMVQNFAVVSGLIAVLCSVMVYVATKRAQWSAGRTGLRFFGTTLLLGIVTVLAVIGSSPEVLNEDEARVFHNLLEALVCTSFVKLAYEGSLLAHVRQRHHSVDKRMAIVMLRDLRVTTYIRFVIGGLGGIVLPIVAVTELLESPLLGPALIGAACLAVAGELVERYLFFRAAPASHMPGGLP